MSASIIFKYVVLPVLFCRVWALVLCEAYFLFLIYVGIHLTNHHHPLLPSFSYYLPQCKYSFVSFINCQVCVMTFVIFPPCYCIHHLCFSSVSIFSKIIFISCYCGACVCFIIKPLFAQCSVNVCNRSLKCHLTTSRFWIY